ncbi:MAG: BatD family protein [Verrucomicrobiota bacterium]
MMLACISSTAAPSLTSSLDRDTISVGESAMLILAYTDCTPTQAPAIPQIPNLAIAFAGQSQNLFNINGVETRSISLNYRLTPSQPGEYTIPAIRTVVSGVTLTTQPLTLRVTKASTETDLAFLKLIVPKQTVYVGETFPVEIQLYFQRAEEIHMPQLSAEGFTMGPTPKPASTRTQVNGRIYTVYIFKMSATAAKAGDLTLGPAQCDLTLLIPQRRRSNDPFDLDDFFSSSFGQRRPTKLSSEPLPMQVLPLPHEGRPPSFNGAVGDFSLAVNAGPTNVTVGDPITLRVQIAGTGTLDSIPFPPQTDWREFQTYTPTSKVETTDPLGMSGVKTFEQVIVPQNAEVRQLPAIAFSFFDPNKKSYRTLQQPPIGIQVQPSARGQPQPTVLAGTATPAPAAPPPTRDIVHIKPHFGQALLLEAPLLLRPGFWVWQTIPVLAWLAALAWRKRADKFARDPRLRRKAQVHKLVRAGLNDLRQLARANRSEDFFALLFRLLQEQLGERLDLPASAITEAVLEDPALAHCAPETLARQLHKLFQACNQARYAPVQTSAELLSLAAEAEAALTALTELKLGR